MSMLVPKEIHLEYTKGGGGGGGGGVWGIFFLNQTKWRLFLIFFTFWQSSLYPQNYELAP